MKTTETIGSILMSNPKKEDPQKNKKREQWRKQIRDLNIRHKESMERLNRSRSRSRDPTPSDKRPSQRYKRNVPNDSFTNSDCRPGSSLLKMQMEVQEDQADHQTGRELKLSDLTGNQGESEHGHRKAALTSRPSVQEREDSSHERKSIKALKQTKLDQLKHMKHKREEMIRLQ